MDTEESLQNITENPQKISSDAEYGQQIQNNDINTPDVEIQSQQINQVPAYNGDSIKNMAANDVMKIQNMIRMGIINPSQGQNLMNHVVKKAYEMVTSQKGLIDNSSNTQACLTSENLNFFNQKGRSEVLDYLKNTNAVVDKDEMAHISKLVERIEQSAINRYLRKQEHEKTLNDENESAKQKLRTNVQRPSSSEIKNMVFTRDQIGKMSGAEFARNERSIMEQLKKGMIR